MRVYELLRFKGPVSGLRQFLTIENPLKIMENSFYFILKTFCSQDIFIFVFTFWLSTKTVCLERYV